MVSQDCSQLAESGDCTFYSSCVEDQIPCGDLGYALNYGKRYCEAFAAHRDNFNDNVSSIVWYSEMRQVSVTSFNLQSD